MVARSEWCKVSKSEPCVICEHKDWCTRSADGQVARCMRVESNKSCAKGGWIHRLADPLPAVRWSPKPIEPTVETDWPRRAKQMFDCQGADAARAELAKVLGVTDESLERLGVGIGYDHRGERFWSFPERNCLWQVVGIVRRYANGKKLTMQGGHHGLYLQPEWWAPPGPIFLPEGGSDTAAMMTAELCVVGRPSNTGGVEHLAQILRHHKHRPVIVLGENDFHPEKVGTIRSCQPGCAGCGHCFPGKWGADITAKQLEQQLGRKIDVRMVDGAKDVRDWMKTRGFDGAEFLESLQVPRKWLALLEAE